MCLIFNKPDVSVFIFNKSAVCLFFNKFDVYIFNKFDVCVCVLSLISLTYCLLYFFLKIECGDAHSVALTEDGRVLTWGRGDLGQCGHSRVVMVERVKVFILTHTYTYH